MIFKDATAAEPAVDLYLGSAHTVDFYWERAGSDLGLPTISAITERADVEPRFCLSGDALNAFKDELTLLFQHLKTPNQGYELSPYQFQVITTIRSTLSRQVLQEGVPMIA